MEMRGAPPRKLCAPFLPQERKDPGRIPKYFISPHKEGHWGPSPLPKGPWGILWLRVGVGLHVVLGHQAVEVRAGAVVAGAKVRDVHLTTPAL